MSLYDINKNEISLINPNLLINGDFRNPINQRGQSSYSLTGRKYTLDRWYSNMGSVGSGNSATVEIREASVYFASNGTYTAFVQLFEFALPQDNYTITVNVKSKSGRTSLRYLDTNDTYNVISDLNVGLNSFTITDTFKGLGMVVMSGANIELEWIKLEQGTHFTGMPITDYVTELAKCMRYYERNIFVASGYSFSLGTSQNIFRVALNYRPKRLPSIPNTNVKLANLEDVINHVRVGEAIPNSRISSIDNTKSVFYRCGGVLTLKTIEALTLAQHMSVMAVCELEIDAEIY